MRLIKLAHSEQFYSGTLLPELCQVMNVLGLAIRK
jgi:hypothetical protein